MSKEDDNHSSTCIICLDILDEKNNDCVLSGNLLQTSCQCKYNIHKDCLNKWLLSRSSDNISCLVCASDAIVITTPKEKCDRNFYRLTSPKNFCVSFSFGYLQFILEMNKIMTQKIQMMHQLL